MRRKGILQEAQVFWRRSLDNGVVSKILDAAANEDNRFVHRVSECLTGVSAHDNGSFLTHKAAHIAAVTANEHDPALDTDSRPGSRVPFDDNRAPADRSSRAISCAAVHYNGSTHYSLGKSPPGAALYGNMWPIAESGAVVADAAFESESYRLNYSDAEIVSRRRIENANLLGT